MEPLAGNYDLVLGNQIIGISFTLSEPLEYLSDNGEDPICVQITEVLVDGEEMDFEDLTEEQQYAVRESLELHLEQSTDGTVH